jgi:two-component system nitrate/nitrite response regulator NarL
LAERLRLLLADDHTLFRQGLRRLLADHSRLVVVGEAASAEEVLRQARALRPDIVLMDVHMPGSGIEATRQLRAELPDIHVLVLTISEDEEDLRAALLAGANGYLLKSSDFDQLLTSLDRLAAGHAAASPEILTKLVQQLRQDEAPAPPARHRGETRRELSEREREILALIAQGASNRQIAQQLYLSENTVRTHLAHILEKLGLENRVQAAAYALRHGLVN